MQIQVPTFAPRRRRQAAIIFLFLVAAGWSLRAAMIGAAPTSLGVASLVLSLLAAGLAWPGLASPERGSAKEDEASRERFVSPTEMVPAEVAASPTLTALWRRGRESGRDEIALAVDGLRDAGSRSLAGMRAAFAEGRPEGAAICARSLAGLASMLGRSQLNRLCRELAEEIERSRSLPEDPETRVDEIETALDEAVAELRRIWPTASRA